MPAFVLCHGEIVFVSPHFVGFVPLGQPLDQPLLVPISVIDPSFPKPSSDSSSSDYGLALDEAWVRRHLADHGRSRALYRGLALGALGTLAAVAITWWVLP